MFDLLLNIASILHCYSLLLLVAIYSNRSVQALALLICDELLHIFLQSYSNALLVFPSFMIIFHDFRIWIVLFQLQILSLFMSSNTCSSHQLFHFPLALLKSYFHFVTFFTTFYFPCLLMWPYHHNLCFFIVFTMSSPYKHTLSSSVFGRLFPLSLGRKFSSLSSQIFLVFFPRPLSGVLFQLHMLPPAE